MDSTCEICGCMLCYGGKDYGKQSTEGRSHAGSHHYVAKRFLSRSNRNGEPHEPIFKNCPAGMEKKEACFVTSAMKNYYTTPYFHLRILANLPS